MADAAASKAAELRRRRRPTTRALSIEARDSRRAGFEKAQAAGLSLREIGEAVGLHWSTVHHILKGK